MFARVLRDYRTQYHDPVTLVVGDLVELGARDSEWPEFIWGTDPGGRSGWIPGRVLTGDRGTVCCIADYSARELDADAGETLRLIRETGGWWWCENARRHQGWLPATHLEIVTAPLPGATTGANA
jgi:hypothetical protein